MRIRLLAGLAIVLLGSVAYAQQAVILPTISVTDTISSNGDLVILRSDGIGGFGSVKVQTIDSYSGTWEVQCALDGNNFDTAAELKMTAADGSTVVVSVTDAVGIWDVVNAAGCEAIRVIATADFSATDTTIVVSGTQSGGGGAGGGSGGGDATAANQTTEISHLATLSGGVSGALYQMNLATLGGTAPATELTFDLNDSGTTQTRAAIAAAVPSAAGAVVVRGAEDEAAASGDGLVGVASVRRDAAATSSGTTGDYSTLNTDALGLLWARTLDPCSGVAKSYLPISIVTATTTEITPALAGASTHYYICSLNLVTAAANNVLVADDDTDNCASPTNGIYGSDGTPAAAEGWNFGANGGISLGNGESSVGRTQGANRVICIITSAATQLSGMLIVVAAP